MALYLTNQEASGNSKPDFRNFSRRLRDFRRFAVEPRAGAAAREPVGVGLWAPRLLRGFDARDRVARFRTCHFQMSRVGLWDDATVRPGRLRRPCSRRSLVAGKTNRLVPSAMALAVSFESHICLRIISAPERDGSTRLLARAHGGRRHRRVCPCRACARSARCGGCRRGKGVLRPPNAYSRGTKHTRSPPE